MNSMQAAGAAVTLPGRPFPLGAAPGELLGVAGTNFAIASSVADSVTLCLFDGHGAETQIPLRDNDADVWHAFGPDVLGQDETDPARPSRLDSAAHVPRSLVVDSGYAWRDENRTRHRTSD